MKRRLVLAMALCGMTSLAQVSATIEITPKQETYYVGQMIRMVLAITVTESDLERVQIVSGFPDPSVMWCSKFMELADETQVVDGKRLTVKRYVAPMRPLAEGTIAFAPVLSGATVTRERRGFTSYQSSSSFTAVIPETRLRVRPLPPAPDNFSGAIGQFRMEASVTPKVASPGDLLTLRWTLSGFGNLEAIVPPKRPSTERFRHYPPREESSEPFTRIAFSEVCIPQTLDATVIEAHTFTTFNPVTGRYDTFAIGPFALTLTERPATEPVPSYVPPEATMRPESVAQMRTLRLAPAATARALTEIPADAPVRILETTDRWQRVLYNGASGWMPR